MGAQIANGAAGALLIAYFIVFGFGTVAIVVGFGTSFVRGISELAHELASCARASEPATIQPLWMRLRRLILAGGWFFFVAYGVILLFWWNRAGLPEVLAYFVACGFAYFAVRRARYAAAPRSSGALAVLAAIVAVCIWAYAWGLNSAIVRGWSASGYFIAGSDCRVFDRCILSGPYPTLAACRPELTAVNGSSATYECIEVRDVPRAYLPWTR